MFNYTKNKDMIELSQISGEHDMNLFRGTFRTAQELENGRFVEIDAANGTIDYVADSATMADDACWVLCTIEMYHRNRAETITDFSNASGAVARIYNMQVGDVIKTTAAGTHVVGDMLQIEDATGKLVAWVDGAHKFEVVGLRKMFYAYDAVTIRRVK